MLSVAMLGRGRPRTIVLHPLMQALVAGGLDSGHVKLYQGTQPRSTLDSASGSTLLATFNVASTPTLANRIGSTSLNLVGHVASATAVASGTAQWIRMLKSDATVYADLAIGTDGYNTVSINDTTPTLGQTLTFTGITVAVYHTRSTVIVPHALLQAVIDGSLVGAFGNIYAGTQPRSVLDPVTGEFLADCAITSAPTSADLLTARSITLTATVSPGMCYVPGTATFLRLFDQYGAEICDVPLGAGTIAIDHSALTAGQVETFTLLVATVNPAIT